MKEWVKELVSISQIKAGDTVEIDGIMKTVCRNNLKYSEFMGITLFGDNYKLGREKVTRLVLK